MTIKVIDKDIKYMVWVAKRKPVPMWKIRNSLTVDELDFDRQRDLITKEVEL